MKMAEVKLKEEISHSMTPAVIQQRVCKNVKILYRFFV